MNVQFKLKRNFNCYMAGYSIDIEVNNDLIPLFIDVGNICIPAFLFDFENPFEKTIEKQLLHRLNLAKLLESQSLIVVDYLCDGYYDGRWWGFISGASADEYPCSSIDATFVENFCKEENIPLVILNKDGLVSQYNVTVKLIEKNHYSIHALLETILKHINSSFS